jgi:hypothetical protein
MKYYPPKTRTMLLLVAMVGFVVSGFAIRANQPVLGWSGIIFGTLAGVNFLIQLVPGSAFLSIEEDVLRYRVLFRDHQVPWGDIRKFSAMTMRDGRTQRIGWFYTAKARETRPLPPEAKGMEKIPDAFLPELYGMKAEELLEKLEDERRKRKTKAS